MGFFNSLYSGLGNLVSSFTEPLLNQQYNYNLKLQQNAQDWQERMSNTAHQRQVQDLRAAGINPLYTATGGSGASSGTVGAGSVQQVNIDPISSIGSIVNMFNQTNATNADAHLKGVQATHELTKLMETKANTLKLLEDTKLSSANRYKVLKQLDEIDANIMYLNRMGLSAVTNAKTGHSRYLMDNRRTSGEQARSLQELEQIKAHPVLSFITNYLRGTKYAK